MLKESADLVILEATFDAKMTLEKHLRSVSSAEAQRLQHGECFERRTESVLSVSQCFTMLNNIL